MLHMHLIHEHFEQSFVDTCVYRKFNNKSTVTIIIWVDDIIVIECPLHREFKMEHMKKLSWFLGIELKCENY